MRNVLKNVLIIVLKNILEFSTPRKWRNGSSWDMSQKQNYISKKISKKFSKKFSKQFFSCESGPRDSNSFDKEEPEPEPESFLRSRLKPNDHRTLVHYTHGWACTKDLGETGRNKTGRGPGGVRKEPCRGQRRQSAYHSAESANDECVFHSRPVTGLLHQVIKSSKINVETHKTIKAQQIKRSDQERLDFVIIVVKFSLVRC